MIGLAAPGVTMGRMLRAPEGTPRTREGEGARARDLLGPAWRGPPKGILVALGVGLVVVVGLLLAFGPVTRGRIAREAERRNLEVDVGQIRPGFFAVTLRDVRVRP